MLRFDLLDRLAGATALVALLAAPLHSGTQKTPPDDGVRAATATWILHVTDERGADIFGAEATLDQLPGAKAGAFEAYRSDPEGIIEFETAAGAARTGSVHLVRDGIYFASRPFELDLPPLEADATRTLEVELEIHPDRKFEGRVVAAETGEPLAGVRVLLDEQGLAQSFSKPVPFDRRVRDVGATDAEGRFEFESRSWLDIDVRLARPDLSPTLALLAQNEQFRDPERPIEMRRGAVLRGRVTFDGVEDAEREIATVDVSCWGYELYERPRPAVGYSNDDLVFRTPIARDGSYELKGLPTDVELDVRVVVNQRPLFEKREPITLEPESERSLDLAVVVGSTIAGVVVDPLGMPLPDQEVVLAYEGHEQGSLTTLRWSDARLTVARTTTDQEGCFRFEDLKARTYRVGFPPLGREEVPHATTVVPLARHVRPGDASENVVLVAHRGLFIEGEVLAPDGTRYPGDTSVFAFSSANQTGLATVFLETSVTDGAFRLGPLLPGAWNLQVSTYGLTYRGAPVAPGDPVAFPAGTTDASLLLEHGAAVSVRAFDVDDTRVAGQLRLTSHSAKLVHTSGIRATGDPATFGGLRTGAYTALVTTADRRVGFKSLNLEPEEVADVRVVVQPAAELEISSRIDTEYTLVEIWVDDLLVVQETLVGDRPNRFLLPAGTTATIRAWPFVPGEEVADEPAVVRRVVATPIEGTTVALEIE